jgi:tetratricopeptide (TPR) repeat protein
MKWLVFGCLMTAAPALVGCGGHTARTLEMRTALDEGLPHKAIDSLNDELDVKSSKDLPKDIQGDNALLVLDRASIQQSIAQFADSSHDFEASDKAIDMLDLAHNAGDTIGEYVFSGASGKYQAPPYEKLLINTLNMINYLERQDLNGAKIEARRLAVMQRYVSDQLNEPKNSVLGLGGFLAGLAFEKSGDTEQALQYYDQALQFDGFDSLRDPVRLLLPATPMRTPRLNEIEHDQTVPPKSLEESNEGELILVVGYGRVPHKISNRIPIGLALTLFASDINPTDQAAANKLAAEGLVTWVNFPTLGKEQGEYADPTCLMDTQSIGLGHSTNVSAEVRMEWHKIEGKIVASAITRTIARFAVGEGIQTATGRGNGTVGIIGFVASLGTQATLAALDTPDTRSWETLPARVAVARIRIPAGRHTIRLDARGVSRTQVIDMPKGGWRVVSLMALR